MQPLAPRAPYARQPGACSSGMTDLTMIFARHSAYERERAA
ncbi:hypothetical protein [Azoarcus sp. L1K30]|nr:hypothetical protein [Azoarcus sp. L1K30]